MNKVTNVVLGGGVTLKAFHSNDFEGVDKPIIASRRSLRGNLMTKPAFTLAEVLITLGIIGVVAAMTIPALMQKTNDKELVSSYLKVHNILNNAYKEVEAIKGYKINALSPSEFKEYLEDHLKTVRCTNHDVCLSDGSYFDYECDGEKCNYITVDTNGKKKPNTAGKDIYKFAITTKGLISEGEQDICSGYDCGNYVLSHHKIFDGLLANCEEYGNDGRCSTCADGYKVNNGLCSAVNMIGCNAYSGESCSSCADGYKNNDGTCEKLNIDNCTKYTGDKCTTCETGFYAKLAGNCEIQPTFCTEMNDDGDSCKLANGQDATFIPSLNEYAWDSGQTTSLTDANTICSNLGMRLPNSDELSTSMSDLSISGHYCNSSSCTYQSGSHKVYNEPCACPAAPGNWNGWIACSGGYEAWCDACGCSSTVKDYKSSSNVLCVGNIE